MTSSTATSGTASPRQDSRLTEDQIAAALGTHYGLHGVAQESLGGEIDQNVKIIAADGRRFVFKASPPVVDPATLRWQNAVLAHLAVHAPEVSMPRIVRDSQGRDVVGIRAGGADHAARLLTWVAGDPLSRLGHHPPTLLTELGEVAGRLTAALSSMAEPDEATSHDWDMRQAPSMIAGGIVHMDDPVRRSNVETIMAWYDEIVPDLHDLPRQVVHQDLNDANILVCTGADRIPRVSGVLDVNDALYTIRVAEIAVCAAYAMIQKEDPLRAAAAVVAGFDSVVRLTDEELAVVFPLAAARLCMNATIWTKRVQESGSAYGQERMRHTWPAIRRVARLVPEVAETVIRLVCGRGPRADGAAKIRRVGEVLTSVVGDARPVDVDLSPSSDLFDDVDWADPAALLGALAALLGDRSRSVGVVEHLRASLPRSARRHAGVDEPATVQLGTGLVLAPGRVVPVPRDAVVEQPGAGDSPLVLRHGDGEDRLWTCWWGLADTPRAGAPLLSGAPLGTVAAGRDEPGFGGFVQVVGVTSGRLALRPPPRHVRPAEVAAWSALAVDVRGLLGLPAAAPAPRGVGEILASRARHFGRSQRAYYRAPMNLVRGRDVWFYDEDGLAYLDSLNNVTHVGHCEPRVTAAALRQTRKLNTNSRFIYSGIASYAERLAATLPPPLEVVFLVCSGSEANDLALRMARQVTGRQDVLVLDGAYHGNTGVVTGISPNRYKGPGGTGSPPTTHEVPIPDRYRGAYGYDDPAAGARFAADAKRVVDGMCAADQRPAAFIAESLMGTAGNIVLPEGFLAASFAAARAAGALCISDEVQVGVGRLGEVFWGFQLAGVVPDIVSMGKPLGNGHPLAAVVTTRAIADAFDTGMKYFNTFGGNPVSCAIGEAVLDIVEGDGLQARAKEIGGYFLEALRDLRTRHPLIGDVRGQGLYLGVELVRDRATKEPAPREAMLVTELMKDRGVITFPNGVHDNVLKIKPPMTFDRGHVDLYVDVLDEVLSAPELR